MLIKDILTESAKDERFIQRLAQGINKFADNYKKSHDKMPRGYLEPGTVGEITGIEGTSDAEKYLTSIGVIFLGGFSRTMRDALGAYRPADGEYSADIGLNLWYLANEAELDSHPKIKKVLSQPNKDLTTTVAHELRHALDDYLSKGKYDQGTEKDYHDRPHEINARFSEVMHKLQQRIEAGEVNRNTFLDIIKTELEQQNITPTPRLIKRAYDFFAN